MKKLFVVLVLAFALLTTPLMAKDNGKRVFVPPVKAFTFQTLDINKIKSSDCSDFQIVDCKFIYELRYNPDRFIYEAYIVRATLTIVYIPNGTVHIVRLDLTSSIM